MISQVRFAVAAASCLATVAAPAHALGASVSPSHLQAGHSTTISVAAGACTSPDLVIIGGILTGGQADLHKHGSHYTGSVKVKSSTSSGHHSLSLRCGGQNDGSAIVTVTGSSHHGGANPPSAGAGIAPFTLQLGATYSQQDTAADGETVHGPIAIKWGACLAAKGKTLAFGKNSGIYDSRGHGYPDGVEMALTGGKSFINQSGIYVSPILSTGVKHLTVTCLSEFGTPLRKAKVQVTLKRKLLTAYRTMTSPSGAFQQIKPGFNGANEQGTTTDLYVSVPACRDRKVTVTLSSPGLVHAVPLVSATNDQRGGVTDFESWETNVYFSDETAVSTPGDYPLTISCGSGQIATGTLRVAP